MRVTICTLFEKEYHLGLAVLVNSLVRAGFTGAIHAGFRGPLPPWTEGLVTQLDATTWELPVADGARLIFYRIETDAHFTNIKPEFMLQVLERSDAEAVLYFDPDIVVDTSWRFLEEWMTCGIAVCDDINSPVAENHPRRVGWRRFFQGTHELRFRGAPYANGGAVGVARVHQRFLEVWKEMLEAVTTSLGGPDVVGITFGGRMLKTAYGFADCFAKTDQDVLNAAIEACPDIPVSFLGKHAMGFEAGTPLLPHALGERKPWSVNFVRAALSGSAPARADKSFWRFADGPLKPYSAGHVERTRWRIRLASGIGRFIRRT